jgi:hypothetical protein
MTSESVMQLRLKIERARRLAKATTDEQAKAALLSYAQELEERLRKA